MSKTLVTGATGFIGGALVNELRARGDEVVALGSRDADLRESGSLDRFSSIRFDRIFHLAAWTQAGDFCLTHQGEQWINNQLIHGNVLRWWRERQSGAKMISLGTSCAYPLRDEPCGEEDYLVGNPLEDLYAYAMTKRMLHIGQESMAKQFGMRWLTLVPSTIYGPGYPLFSGRQAHFIIDIALKIIAHAESGAEIVLWGDGGQRRELVYLGDFIRDALTLAERIDDEIVNVAAGESHTIREFAEALCGIVGVNPAAIRYDTSKYVGARVKTLCGDKIEQLLPGRRMTPLEEGLRTVVEDIRRQKAEKREEHSS